MKASLHLQASLNVRISMHRDLNATSPCQSGTGEALACKVDTGEWAECCRRPLMHPDDEQGK